MPMPPSKRERTNYADGEAREICAFRPIRCGPFGLPGARRSGRKNVSGHRTPANRALHALFALGRLEKRSRVPCNRRGITVNKCKCSAAILRCAFFHFRLRRASIQSANRRCGHSLSVHCSLFVRSYSFLFAIRVRGLMCRSVC